MYPFYCRIFNLNLNLFENVQLFTSSKLDFLNKILCKFVPNTAGLFHDFQESFAYDKGRFKWGRHLLLEIWRKNPSPQNYYLLLKG